MNAPPEEWRTAPGHPNYEVSSIGRVRNTATGRLRKLKVNSNGYLILSVADGRGSSSNVYVSRLVCKAFHGTPTSTGMHCDHVNGARDDNRAANLRWLTPEENRALRKFALGEARPQSKLTEAAVRAIRSAPPSVSNPYLAERFSVSTSTVQDARTFQTWRHVDV